jgi:large subunit ribosomal protein L24
MAASVSRTRVPDIRKGDTVVVLSGKDAGKRGVVDRVYSAPRSGARFGQSRGADRARRGAYVVIEGINLSKRHTKPRSVSSSTDRMPRVQQGGILDIPQPLAAGKVMLVCGRCDRPTRVAHQTLESGARVRVCHHCGEPLEVRQ